MAHQLVDRMIRAAKLDVQLYEEVEADESALTQSMLVVILSSVAAGIGGMGAGGGWLIMGAVGALIGWFVWALLIYFIGTKMLPEPQTKATYTELLRTIGFAASPGVLRVFAIIPVVAGLVHLVVTIWALVAMVIAVRQALDYTGTPRAVGVCAIGWLIQILTMALFLSMAGAGGSL